MLISYHFHIRKRKDYKFIQIPSTSIFRDISSLSGVPDYFGRNKISSGGDLSHYSSASLY